MKSSSGIQLGSELCNHCLLPGLYRHVLPGAGPFHLHLLHVMLYCFSTALLLEFRFHCCVYIGFLCDREGIRQAHSASVRVDKRKNTYEAILKYIVCVSCLVLLSVIVRMSRTTRVTKGEKHKDSFTDHLPPTSLAKRSPPFATPSWVFPMLLCAECTRMPGARDRSRLSLRYATSSDVPFSPWAGVAGNARWQPESTENSA